MDKQYRVGLIDGLFEVPFQFARVSLGSHCDISSEGQRSVGLVELTPPATCEAYLRAEIISRAGGEIEVTQVAKIHVPHTAPVSLRSCRGTGDTPAPNHLRVAGRLVACHPKPKAKVADGVRFELTVGLPPRRFSRPVP